MVEGGCWQALQEDGKKTVKTVLGSIMHFQVLSHAVALM